MISCLAEQTDAVDRAGMTAIRETKPTQPARQLILGVRPRIWEAVVTWMFEVYYAAPTDPAREARLLELVRGHGGWLDCREAPEVDGSHNVCLTFEFEDLEQALSAARQVRASGEHVEGPGEYG